MEGCEKQGLWGCFLVTIQDGANKHWNRLIRYADQHPGVSHRAHRAFVVRGTRVVGMDVIGLGKPREQDQDRAQQRKRHLARRNRSLMLAIHQRKLTPHATYNYNARTPGELDAARS